MFIQMGFRRAETFDELDKILECLAAGATMKIKMRTVDEADPDRSAMK